MPLWAWALVVVAAVGIGWLVVGAVRRPGIGQGADPEARERLIEPGGDDIPARAEGLARPEDDR